jgi:chitinase
MQRIFVFLSVFFLFHAKIFAQQKKHEVAVIAYYTGSATAIDSFELDKITHIIFSFCHLKGDSLHVNNARDTAVIQKLVSLKSQYPSLKIMLSLGGWGGCQTCSDVFSTKKGRKTFAASVRDITDYFQTDGIDLDWEYPAIEGFPGHAYAPADRENFTALVKELRKKLGRDKLISFAAGGFSSYINASVDWKKLLKKVSFVNLMSYDLVSGVATVTGHHTPLFSNRQQIESVDHAIHLFDSLHVPRNKIVIGAAFYARTWENVDTARNGLYQSGNFKSFIPYFVADTIFRVDSGYVFHFDAVAKAGYAYNPSQKIFATYDDTASVKAKTEYVISKGLKGIRFLKYFFFGNSRSIKNDKAFLT